MKFLFEKKNVVSNDFQLPNSASNAKNIMTNNIYNIVVKIVETEPATRVKDQPKPQQKPRNLSYKIN